MAACGRTPTVQSHSFTMYTLPVPISAVYHSMYMYNVCVRVVLGARVSRSDAMKIQKKSKTFFFFHIKYTETLNLLVHTDYNIMLYVHVPSFHVLY